MLRYLPQIVFYTGLGMALVLSLMLLSAGLAAGFPAGPLVYHVLTLSMIVLPLVIIIGRMLAHAKSRFEILSGSGAIVLISTYIITTILLSR
jgi:hypothetical protein